MERKIYDWERLATASLEVTTESTKQALAITREDEQEATEVRASSSLDDTVHLLEDFEDESVSGSVEHNVVKRKTCQRKSKPKCKSKSKTRCSDPPGSKIKREISQNASDILIQMRMASLNARNLTV
jgi:hypothetical protein